MTRQNWILFVCLFQGPHFDIRPFKGERGVYKGQKSHNPMGVYHSNSSKLSLKFQAYPKYYRNKETYWYVLLMNYLMNIPRCTTKIIERKFPLKPYLPENLFLKYYSYEFKMWLFAIWSYSPVLLRTLCQGVWTTLTLARPNDLPWP